MMICVREAGHDGECVPFETATPEAPEPSREDRYEAAVRAVLDLCDREDLVDLEEGVTVAWGEISTKRIRRAIADALAEGAPAPAPEPPVSISGPGAASARIYAAEVLGGPEPEGQDPWAGHGGEPTVVAQMRLEAARRDQRGGQR